MLLSDLITPEHLFEALFSKEIVTPRLDRLKPLIAILNGVAKNWPGMSKKEKQQMVEDWIFLISHIDQAIEISTTRR